MQAFDFGSAFAQTFKVYFANLLSFVVIVAVVTIPSTIYDGVGTVTGLNVNPAYSIGSSIIALILGSIVSGALVYGVLQEIRGNHVSIGDCFTAGLKHVLPVVGVGIVTGLAIGFGVLFCIVPGLILATMWYVAVPVTVVEGRGVFDALSRSGQLTSGYRWPVFGFLLCVGLIVIGVILAVMIPVALIEGADLAAGETGGILTFIATTIVGFFTTAFIGTSSSVVYFHLRRAKEGFDTEQIAGIFA